MLKSHIVAEWECDSCGKTEQLVLPVRKIIGLPNQGWTHYDISRVEYEFDPDHDEPYTKESGPQGYHFCPTCSQALATMLDGVLKEKQNARPGDEI